MADDHEITQADTLHFDSGKLFVNDREFAVLSIDGEPPESPIAGVEGDYLLTTFRGHVNQWHKTLVYGAFIRTGPIR